MKKLETLTGKTAVIIGGGGGVGRGVSLGLAQAGANVVVADIDLELANKVKDEIVRRNGSAIAAVVDSTSDKSLNALVYATVNEFSEVNILVNTVGVILERPLIDVTDEDWSWVWKLNVMSQIKSVRAFLPHLRKSDGAHIVTTISGAGLISPSVELSIGAYSTTKHALVGYSGTLRAELAQENIGVTMLCPSAIEGNLAKTSAASRKQHLGESADDPGGHQPPGRLLESQEPLGLLLVEAIKANRFFVSNRPGAICEALKEQYDDLAEDASYFENLTHELSA